MCQTLNAFCLLSFIKVNEGKASSVTAESMKTEPDNKAKGEKMQYCCNLKHITDAN